MTETYVNQALLVRKRENEGPEECSRFEREITDVITAFELLGNKDYEPGNDPRIDRMVKLAELSFRAFEVANIETPDCLDSIISGAKYVTFSTGLHKAAGLDLSRDRMTVFGDVLGYRTVLGTEAVSERPVYWECFPFVPRGDHHVGRAHAEGYRIVDPGPLDALAATTNTPEELLQRMQVRARVFSDIYTIANEVGPYAHGDNSEWFGYPLQPMTKFPDRLEERLSPKLGAAVAPDYFAEEPRHIWRSRGRDTRSGRGPGYGPAWRLGVALDTIELRSYVGYDDFGISIASVDGSLYHCSQRLTDSGTFMNGVVAERIAPLTPFRESDCVSFSMRGFSPSHQELPPRFVQNPHFATRFTLQNSIPLNLPVAENGVLTIFVNGVPVWRVRNMVNAAWKPAVSPFGPVAVTANFVGDKDHAYGSLHELPDDGPSGWRYPPSNGESAFISTRDVSLNDMVHGGIKALEDTLKQGARAPSRGASPPRSKKRR